MPILLLAKATVAFGLTGLTAAAVLFAGDQAAELVSAVSNLVNEA